MLFRLATGNYIVKRIDPIVELEHVANLILDILLKDPRRDQDRLRPVAQGLGSHDRRAESVLPW